MTAALRAARGGAAVKAAAAVGYVGAGTVEFIADAGAGLREDRFWFLEMNTRLQVEHPVTEAVTGLDLVEWQFRIAAGEPLPLRQADVPLSGHAIEARVYAEDVERGFLPSTGRLIAWQAPQGEGIRIDSGVEAGDAVSPHYDPMIAKVIAHASARDQARQRLLHALEEIVAAGPRTNLAFLIALLGHPDFARGGVDTGFIDRSLAALGAVPAELDRAAAACGIAHLVARDAGRGAQPGTWVSPWDARDGFQLLGERRVRLPFVADGASIVAEISHGPAGIAVTIDGVEAAVDARVIDAAGEVFVLRRGRQTVVRPREVSEVEASAPAGDGLVRAPMHGKLLAVLVAPGASVRRGQPVAVVEAMKMEHALAAPCDGVVGAVLASTGSQVTEGTPILRIEPTQPADEP
jgi:3-methylcrotonyl-CoA carboxylase alpha subunit